MYWKLYEKNDESTYDFRLSRSFEDTDNSQDNRVREGTVLFVSTTFTFSRTFRYLPPNLHARWLPRIYNSIILLVTRLLLH